MAIPPDAYEAIAVLTLPVMAMMMYAMVKVSISPSVSWREPMSGAAECHLPCGTMIPTRALPPRCSRS